MAKFASSKSESGFSLVETLVATGLLAGAVAILGQMFAISMAENTSARTGTFAAVLAEQKMEQLRGLTWGFDIIGLPLTDTSSNVALPIQAATGGPGLSPSPSDSLRSNVSGYVDYVDQFAASSAAGRRFPPRRSISALGRSSRCRRIQNNTVICGLVTRSTRSGHRGQRTRTHATDGDEARLMTVKTRKSQ